VSKLIHDILRENEQNKQLGFLHMYVIKKTAQSKYRITGGNLPNLASLV
jgi:hypothetical protein